MPVLLDSILTIDTKTAEKYIRQENTVVIELFNINHDKYEELDEYYDREFTSKYPDVEDLIE